MAQFRELAEQRKNEANERILTGAAAMAVAEFGAPGEWSGLTVPVVWPGSMKDGVSLTDTSGKVYEHAYAWGPYFDEWPAPSMEVSIDADGNVEVNDSGSSGTVEDPFTTAFVNTVYQGAGPSATVSATSGNLLVAVAVHRTIDSDAQFPGTPTATGYSLQGVAGYKTAGSVSDRRAIAVFTRIATGTSADNFTCVWPNTSTVNNVTIQQFTVSDAPGHFTYVGTDGNATQTTTLALSAATGVVNENALMIVGVTTRENAGTISWSGASNGVSHYTTTMTTSMASAQVNGSGPHTATPTWPTAQYASGFVLLIRP